MSSDYIEQCADSFDFDICRALPMRLTTIDELPRQIVSYRLLKDKGWFILEHTPRNNYEGYPYYVTQRNYGTTIFSIFVKKT